MVYAAWGSHLAASVTEDFFIFNSLVSTYPLVFRPRALAFALRRNERTPAVRTRALVALHPDCNGDLIEKPTLITLAPVPVRPVPTGKNRRQQPTDIPESARPVTLVVTDVIAVAYAADHDDDDDAERAGGSGGDRMMMPALVRVMIVLAYEGDAGVDSEKDTDDRRDEELNQRMAMRILMTRIMVVMGMMRQ